MTGNDEPTGTMAVSYGQTPDGRLTLVLDGRAVHPDDPCDLSSEAVATLMYEAARHAAEQAARQAGRTGTWLGLGAGAKAGRRAGLLSLGAIAASLAATPDDAA